MCLHNTYVTAADIINYNSALAQFLQRGKEGVGATTNTKTVATVWRVKGTNENLRFDRCFKPIVRIFNASAEDASELLGCFSWKWYYITPLHVFSNSCVGD